VTLEHHFLIPMPGLTGGYFTGSLIYLCAHSTSGATGLIVNRACNTSLTDLCRQLGCAEPIGHKINTIFEGGPVAPDRGLVLHTDDQVYPGSSRLAQSLILSSGTDVLADTPNKSLPEQHLVALGYAGWGSGQLESELSEDVWLTCAADLDVIFDNECDNKLARVAQAMGIDTNLLAGKIGHD